MTYIKWKDEVESYLGNLSADEKQKIFSYFAEMYADKRDAGKSEAQIIEEFGAPYDVAKRILDGSKENSPSSGDGAGNNPAGVNGGNNYNYNYYNYNYGGAPQQQPQSQQPQPPQYAQPPRQSQPQQPLQKENYPQGAPAAEISGTPQPEKKNRDVGHVVATVVFAILLTGLSIFLIGAPVAAIVQGFANIAAGIGALIVTGSEAGIIVLSVGYGLINVGAGFLLLAPFSALTKFLWKKLKAFM